MKSWIVSILTENLHHKIFSQASDVCSLVSYLRTHFPKGNYLSTYEADFSDFWAYYKLLSMGVQNIIINPADVPIGQKETLQKTDAVDSRKIARFLRTGELTGIYIPEICTLEIRTLLRSRDAIVLDLSRMKQCVKSLLYAGVRK